MALGAELTMYVSSNISFFGTIRLDYVDNARANTSYSHYDAYDKFTTAAELSLSMYMHHKSSFVDVNPCTQRTEGDTVHGVSHQVTGWS